jgi:hypothetical protein
LGLFALLAGGIACVARRLALGLERGFSGGGLFLFARELGRGGSGCFFLAPLLLRLGSLASKLCLGALGGYCLALSLPLLDCGIVGTGLAAKLAQDALPGFSRRFLPVGEAGLLKSTH